MSKEKIFLIGSNSFSGASFIDYVLSEGIDVTGTSRSEEAHPAFLPYKWKDHPGKFTFHQLDLNKDLDAIVELIESEKPDYVINFAAQSMVGQSWEFPEHWFMTNVVSNVKLHNRLRHFDWLKKYVHISTPEVYGNCSGYINEETNFNPSTPYAVSRAAADMSLKTFYDAYNFPVVWTRAANVYGPGQQLYRIIPRTVFFIRLGRKMQLHGGGVSRRSFIHMHDVSDATLRIARNAPAGQTYHISTKDDITIRELVEKICHMMQVNFDDHVEIVGERLGKDSAYLLDSTKLRNEHSWSDNVSLDDGIIDVIKWIDSNFEELKKQPVDYQHKA